MKQELRNLSSSLRDVLDELQKCDCMDFTHDDKQELNLLRCNIKAFLCNMTDYPECDES